MDAKNYENYNIPLALQRILPQPYSYIQKKLDKRDKIKILRQALEAGHIMGTACRIAFISPFTLHTWKKRSNLDRLAKLVYTARDRGQETRNDIVEDAQFRRLALGIASGSEYEFYLTNRRTDRWKKLNEFGSGQGAPVLLKPPVINYISVAVTVDKNGEASHDNGNGNGNGNGRHLEHAP